MSCARRRSRIGSRATSASNSRTSSRAERARGQPRSVPRRAPAQLLESHDLYLRERLESEVRKRRPAPERERLAQHRGGDVGIVLRAPSVPRGRAARSGVRRCCRAPRAGHSRASGRGAGCTPPSGRSLSSVLRSCETRTRSAARPLFGGFSDQRSSRSRSSGTTSFALSRRRARSARCFRPRSGRRRPPSSTSSGPRIRNSI